MDSFGADYQATVVPILVDREVSDSRSELRFSAL